MTRIDYYKVTPGGVKAVYGLGRYLRESQLGPSLIELVKLRASLMNGCAYCVDIHTKDARAQGETEQRLFAVPVWRPLSIEEYCDGIPANGKAVPDGAAIARNHRPRRM